MPCGGEHDRHRPDDALHGKVVPPAADVISGVGGGGLMTAGRGAPDTPRPKRRATARTHAPRFCNTCGAEQPIAAFDRDPALPLSRRYKCTACRERSQQPRPRSDPRQISGAQSDALLLTSEVMGNAVRHAGPVLTRAEPSKPPTVELLWQPDDSKPTSARPAKTWTGFVPISDPLPRKHMISRRADARAQRAPGCRRFLLWSVQPLKKWGGP